MVRICEHVGKKAPGGRQTLLVSATLTPRVLQRCAPWCANPRQVFVGTAPAAAAAAAAEAEAAAEAAQAAQRAERAQQAQRGEAGMEGQERRPAWGWGDAKAPSADAADYFPGQCPGRLERFEARSCRLHELMTWVYKARGSKTPSSPRLPAPVSPQAPPAPVAWAARRALPPPCRRTCATTSWRLLRSTRLTRYGEPSQCCHHVEMASCSCKWAQRVCAAIMRHACSLRCALSRIQLGSSHRKPGRKCNLLRVACSTMAMQAEHPTPCRCSIHAMGM